MLSMYAVSIKSGTLEVVRVSEELPDFFGIATIGERGQIVIPKDARDALGLAAGDKIVVLPNRHGNGMLLMKEENIKKLAQEMSERAERITTKINRIDS